MEPGTYEFKVASEDWSTVNLGALSSADSDRNLFVGGALALAPTNDNLILTIDNPDRYVFVFDVSDKDAPTIGVYKEAFWGETNVYVRGGMNGWGAEDVFSYLGNGEYVADVELSAGSVEFKVASEDWSTVNLGNPNESATNVVDIDRPKVLGSSNNNLMMDVPQSGLYQFRVSGPNGAAPTLTVTLK